MGTRVEQATKTGIRSKQRIARIGLFAAAAAVLAVTAPAQTRPAIVLNQTTLLAGFPAGGALSGGAPAGNSFGVNSLGNLITSTTYGGTIVQFNGSTGAATTLGSYNNPGPVAIDGNNNLFIADAYDTTIVKVPYSASGGYAAISSPGSGTPTCTGTDTAECKLPFTVNTIYGYATMTFDSAGNLYFSGTNGGTNANGILKVPAAGIYSSSTTPTLLYMEPASSSAQLLVGELAVDPFGDVFFTDSVTNSSSHSYSSNLKELKTSTTGTTGYAATPVTLYTLTVASPSDYDNQLDGVAVDKNGTVYFATEFDGIFAMLNTGGVVDPTSLYTVSNQGAKMLTTDGNGNFYIATYSNTTGGDAAIKISVGLVNFPSTPTGSSSTVTNVNTILEKISSCSGSPTVSYTSTSTEFTAATNGNCSTANITNASVIPTTATFTPSTAGTRTATLTATDSGGNVGTATLTGTGAGTPAATPTFSPGAGTYTSIQNVTVSDTTSGSTIYYTTDGSTPTASSTKYTAPVSVAASETLKAIAVAAGFNSSAVGSAAYVINLPPAATPTLSPGTGTYTSVQTVTLSDATANSTIYYTTDGTTPTTSSTQYTAPISVSATETITAIATATGYSTSASGAATYTIHLPAATPTFTPPSGTYNAVQSVTISDSTSGATIYYTTDGSTPTTASKVYSGPVSVGATSTVQAVAISSNTSLSAIGSASYTINLPTFTLTVNPSSLTIPPGTNGVANVNITPLYTFASTVSFACTGLPTGATCSFTPATLTPVGTTTQTTVLTITPPTTASLLERGGPLGRGVLPPATLALAFCILGLRKRRRLKIALLMVACCFGLSPLSGCSSNSTPAHTYTTYTVTVTATSGTIQKSAAITVMM